ncbi:MAG TPA: hypothetical protein VFF77_03485, partial [Holophagaceae bacterium]|nr:hypothetical protein [Holophagaceae bacterium]
MILAPAYPIVAGPVHQWPILPPTTLWKRPRHLRFVGRRDPTPEELAGLGSFFKKVAHVISNIAVAPIKLVSKKAAANLQKVDNKVIDAVDAIHTKVGDVLHKIGHKIGKNWKWIAIIAAIAITIYTMGAGATIAAHMISGMEALGHAIATGATAVAHAVGIGTGSAAATGGAAAAAGTTTAAASTSWIATGAKLALSAATALTQQKAKVSDLSQQQAQALLEAQQAGYGMGADDPQLQQALVLRAQIAGAGIPTDAQGNPLLKPDQTGAGYLMPDGSVAEPDDPRVLAARAAGQPLLQVQPSAAPSPFAALTSN